MKRVLLARVTLTLIGVAIWGVIVLPNVRETGDE